MIEKGIALTENVEDVKKDDGVKSEEAPKVAPPFNFGFGKPQATIRDPQQDEPDEIEEPTPQIESGSKYTREQYNQDFQNAALALTSLSFGDGLQQHITESFPCHKMWARMMTFALIGMIANNARMKFSRFTVYPNIFCLNVGPSGIGKSWPVDNILMEILGMLDDMIYSDEIKAWQVTHDQEVKDGIPKKEMTKRPFRENVEFHYPGRMTSEGLIKDMHAREERFQRVLAWCDEITRLVKVAADEKSSEKTAMEDLSLLFGRKIPEKATRSWDRKTIKDIGYSLIAAVALYFFQIIKLDWWSMGTGNRFPIVMDMEEKDDDDANFDENALGLKNKVFAQRAKLLYDFFSTNKVKFGFSFNEAKVEDEIAWQKLNDWRKEIKAVVRKKRDHDKLDLEAGFLTRLFELTLKLVLLRAIDGWTQYIIKAMETNDYRELKLVQNGFVDEHGEFQEDGYTFVIFPGTADEAIQDAKYFWRSFNEMLGVWAEYRTGTNSHGDNMDIRPDLATLLTKIRKWNAKGREWRHADTGRELGWEFNQAAKVYKFGMTTGDLVLYEKEKVRGLKIAPPEKKLGKQDVVITEWGRVPNLMGHKHDAESNEGSDPHSTA